MASQQGYCRAQSHQRGIGHLHQQQRKEVRLLQPPSQTNNDDISPDETLEHVDRCSFTPPDALLGGIPTVTLDVPITAIFLVLFLLGAATHMTIYNKNSKRGHKFILSDLLFNFCMVRAATTTMRIVWAFKPTITKLYSLR